MLAGGFGLLSFLFPIWATTNIDTLDYGYIYIWVMTGYYIFFCLFMVGAVLRLELVMTYCGFLNSVFVKGLFYVFLASLALVDLRSIANDIVGGVFAAIAVISWITYCGKGKEGEAAKA